MSRYEQPERWIGEGLVNAAYRLGTALIFAATILGTAIVLHGC